MLEVDSLETVHVCTEAPKIVSYHFRGEEIGLDGRQSRVLQVITPSNTFSWLDSLDDLFPCYALVKIVQVSGNYPAIAKVLKENLGNFAIVPLYINTKRKLKSTGFKFYYNHMPANSTIGTRYQPGCIVLDIRDSKVILKVPKLGEEPYALRKRVTENYYKKYFDIDTLLSCEG